MAIDISDHLRSDEGKRRGGHTRVGESAWGKMDAARAKNATGRGDPPYTQIGSHGPAPAKPLQPGASEGKSAGL
jgi:hypothetical protein